MYKEEHIEWAEDILCKLKEKMPGVTKRTINKIPYTTTDGRFDDLSESNPNWWTNGFWGGMMWQMYHATGEEIYKEAALINEDKLDGSLSDFKGLDHDNGFKWLPTSAAHLKVEYSEKSLNRVRLAADNLAGRFNCKGNFIRAWNDENGNNAGWAIVDCLMNLPLLYRAWENTNDPRYLHVATSHADMALKYILREDGSVNHIVVFDPLTGEFIESRGGQGMKDGSSWTRGQAWGLYGFTLSFIHTKEERYLKAAERIADYFIKNIPESGLIPVDFLQPKEISWQDSTAAAIAACGLLELSKASGNEGFEDAAFRLLSALERENVCWDPDRDELTEKCTAAYNDDRHEFTIIYGDYFFIEAVLKLAGKELFIW